MKQYSLFFFIFLLTASGCALFKQPCGSDPCGQRVGISQNIPERKRQWRAKCPELYNWKLVKCDLTYDEAQDIEKQYLKKCYEGHAGGRPKKSKNYCVYTFQY